jgi:hypothetical protein
MRIVDITDLHGGLERLQPLGNAISGADLVILSGDITHFGAEREAKAVIDAVRGFNERVYAVPGNCDYPGVLSYLESEGLSLHGKVVTLGGHAIAGVGGSLPCPGKTPNEFSEEELGEILRELETRIPAATPLLFVSHQPPRGTVCDLAGRMKHVGSLSIRSFIERARPLVCFCGHIHEAVGIDSIGGSRIVNPGPLRNESYASASVSDLVESLSIVSGGKTVMSL